MRRPAIRISQDQNQMQGSFMSVIETYTGALSSTGVCFSAKELPGAGPPGKVSVLNDDASAG
jgi:hypothetical protein